MPLFEQEVATKDGVTRMIRATTLEALNEAVQAAQHDAVVPTPDISGDPEPEVAEVPEPVEKPKRGRPIKVVPVVENEAAREADDSIEAATVKAEAEAGTVE